MRDGAAVIERNAPVVQGKNALLRVYVEPLPGFQPRELAAELTLRSSTAAGTSVLVRKLIEGESSESELDTTINFDMPGTNITGDVSWSVTLREVDLARPAGTIDDGARYPAGDGETELLHPRFVGPLRVMLVPYEYHADGSRRVPDTSEDQLRRYRAYLTRYFPTGDVLFELHEPVAYEQKVDPTSGWDAFLDFHCALRASESPEPAVFYYGLIDPTRHALEYADGSVGRSFIPGPANSQARCSVGLGFSGGGSAIIMAHELGHAFGLGHAPCDADDAAPFPYEGGRIGSWGFDFLNRELMSPDERYDLMGLCDPVFISDYAYQKVFERMRYVNLQSGNRDPNSIDLLPGEWGNAGTKCGVGLPVSCELGAEKCCVRSLAADSCIDVDLPCTCDVDGCSTLHMYCDGPEDCSAGQVCCGTLEDPLSGEFSAQGNRYLEFSCRTNCDQDGGDRIACNQAHPVCPTGMICSSSQLLTNLQVCVNPPAQWSQAARGDE